MTGGGSETKNQPPMNTDAHRRFGSAVLPVAIGVHPWPSSFLLSAFICVHLRFHPLPRGPVARRGSVPGGGDGGYNRAVRGRIGRIILDVLTLFSMVLFAATLYGWVAAGRLGYRGQIVLWR